MDASGLTIRPLAEEDSITELTGLLHRAYGRLAAMGLRFFATHQSDDDTRDRVAGGRCFVGVRDGAIVGTITLYPPRAGSTCAWYARPGVAHFGQFAVDPECQGCGFGNRLLEHVETVAREDGNEELALDTAEPAAHLIDYYARHGYRFIEHVQWDVTNYRSVVMSKRL